MEDEKVIIGVVGKEQFRLKEWSKFKSDIISKYSEVRFKICKTEREANNFYKFVRYEDAKRAREEKLQKNKAFKFHLRKCRTAFRKLKKKTLDDPVDFLFLAKDTEFPRFVNARLNILGSQGILLFTLSGEKITKIDYNVFQGCKFTVIGNMIEIYCPQEFMLPYHLNIFFSNPLDLLIVKEYLSAVLL